MSDKTLVVSVEYVITSPDGNCLDLVKELVNAKKDTTLTDSMSIFDFNPKERNVQATLE